MELDLNEQITNWSRIMWVSVEVGVSVHVYVFLHNYGFYVLMYLFIMCV